MTKDNFYIITGGPGGGKTTLLESLVLKGYSFIPETARQIIKDRLSKGFTPRPDPISFAREIFDKDLSNFKMNADCTFLLFFDRSFMDSACMLFDCDQDSYNRIKDTHLNNRYNNKVFITPPWKDIYQTDTERDQTFEESIVVYKRLDQWYRQHGYNVIVLPKVSTENRVKFILSHLTKLIQ